MTAVSALKKDSCRSCGSRDIALFLSLGKQPPSNSFLKPGMAASEIRYPLDVYFCRGCGLAQLLDVVPAEAIFDDYLYLSSSSKALKAHYAALAVSLAERFALKAGEVVVDVGCNDGILLHGYPPLPGLVRVGVEPSKVADAAVQSGIPVVRAFFGKEAAREIVDHFGAARVVTATNVFAHVDGIRNFAEAVPDLLSDDGVFVIEVSYLIDVIDQLLFDTIYHEHLLYWSLTSLAGFLPRCGLEIFDAERVDFGASGPALRVFSAKRNAHPVSPRVSELLEFERSWGVRDFKRYADYAVRVRGVKEKILDLLSSVRRGGGSLGAYGAPAKGNTLLNYLGLNADTVDCVAETNVLKQGLLTPGSHIPIVSEEEFLRRMPGHALLLSWNYLDFFLKNSPYIRQGGRFVVPLPTPKVVPSPP